MTMDADCEASQYACVLCMSSVICHVQIYSVKGFGAFFTWVYHVEEAVIQSLDNFNNAYARVTMNQMKFFQGLYNLSPTRAEKR